MSNSRTNVKAKNTIPKKNVLAPNCCIILHVEKSTKFNTKIRDVVVTATITTGYTSAIAKITVSRSSMRKAFTWRNGQT